MDTDGSKDIWEALKNGSLPGVKYHCAKNAYNIIQKNHKEKFWSPLHYASDAGHIAIVSFLLEKKVNVDVLDSEDQTPLMRASLHGHLSVVTTLLNNGADVNQQDAFKRTSLHWAMYENHLDIVKELIQNRADKMITNKMNLTPLAWARSRFDEYDRTEILNYLPTCIPIKPFNIIRNNIKKNVWSPLHYASDGGHIRIVSLLLKKGAKVDEVDMENQTPLMRASLNGHVSVVKLLIKKGADVNLQDTFKRTPLHWAMYENHYDIVKKLLKNGAIEGITNKNDLTPLAWARKRIDQHDRRKMCKLFKHTYI